MRLLSVAFKFTVSLFKRLHKGIGDEINRKDIGLEFRFLFVFCLCFFNVFCIEDWCGDETLAEQSLSLFDAGMTGHVTFEEVLECCGLVLRDREALLNLLTVQLCFLG